jgi:protein-disulfide isomerase
MILRKYKMALVATLLTFGLSGTSAIAQSTPVPDEHDHDHAESAPVPIRPGSFQEIETDHVVGAVSAPTTMIIYASVTCPHCAYWFETVWPGLKSDYVETGKLRVVFREFPTAPAQLSFAGFLLANCAPQDQYFAMIEHQMAEQAALMDAAKNGFAKEAYLEVAQKAGLKDEEAMNTCLSDKDGIARIQNSLELAQSAKVGSVPNFIIGGELYKGKSEYVPLTSYINDLTERGSTSLPKR